MYLMRLLVVISVHLFSVAAALAQPAANAAAAPATANVATATRAAEAPTIDGDVLGDPAWATGHADHRRSGRSSRTKGSRRRSGPKCASSSPRDTLYIGAVLYDSRSVRHHRVRCAPRRAAGRHRQLPDDLRHLSRSAERVRVRHQPGRHRVRRPGDQRRAGRRRPWLRPDAVGRLGRRLQHQLGRRVDGAGEDHRARLDGRVRDSVPHAALSRRAPTQTWGINFQRNIRRRNERAYWAPIPRQFNLYRLSLAGSLAGVQTPALRNFRITPYGLGNAARRRA